MAPDVDWEQPEKGHLDTTDRQALAEWLAKHPNNFWALTLYAKNLLADRKWTDAKEPLKKLIALYPEYSGSAWGCLTADDNGYLLLAEAPWHGLPAHEITARMAVPHGARTPGA